MRSRSSASRCAFVVLAIVELVADLYLPLDYSPKESRSFALVADRAPPDQIQERIHIDLDFDAAEKAFARHADTAGIRNAALDRHRFAVALNHGRSNRLRSRAYRKARGARRLSLDFL